MTAAQGRWPASGGYTVIEIVVVLAIVAMVAGIAAVVIQAAGGS